MRAAILLAHNEPLVVEEIIRRSGAAADIANSKRRTGARRAARTKRTARAKRPRG